MTRALLGFAILVSVYAALVFTTAASKLADQFGKHLRHDFPDTDRAAATGDFKVSHSTTIGRERR